MRPPRLQGASLIDVLAGLALGLLCMVIMYQAFVALDAARRTATAAAEAEAGGAFALHALAVAVDNAGAGVALTTPWLDTCPATADAATTLRPIPVVVTDGGAPDRPDSIVVRQSLAPFATPAALADATSAGAHLRVESVGGFTAGDRIVAISRTGTCVAADITEVEAAVAGVTELTTSPIAVDLPPSTVVVNLGRAGGSAVMRYDLVAGNLRTTDVGNGDAPAPIATNVVNAKFQYGIDVDGDGVLDTWTPATGAWRAADVLAAPRATLARIGAVRIGLVVRTEERERMRSRPEHWVLFDCELPDKTACPGRLEGTIAPTSAGGYRYRTFESVVALRNALWNRAP
jgi:type IV pilus assembly protein PilW